MPIMSLTSGLFINFDKVQTITREGPDDAAVYVIEFENGKRETFLGEDAKDLRLLLQQCVDLRERLRNPPPAMPGWPGGMGPDPAAPIIEQFLQAAREAGDPDIPPLTDQEKARTEAAAAALAGNVQHAEVSIPPGEPSAEDLAGAPKHDPPPAATGGPPVQSDAAPANNPA